MLTFMIKLFLHHFFFNNTNLDSDQIVNDIVLRLPVSKEPVLAGQTLVAVFPDTGLTSRVARFTFLPRLVSVET